MKRNHKNIINNKPGIIVTLPPLSLPLSLSIPVTQDFRSWFLTYFGLKNVKPRTQDYKLFRLASFLLPGSHTNFSEDDSEPEIVLSSEFVSHVVRPGGTGKDLNIEDLLAEFNKRFWKVKYEDACRFNGRARKVTEQSYPKKLLAKLQEEEELIGVKPMIDLVSGEPWPYDINFNLPGSTVPEIEQIRKELNAIPASEFEHIKGLVPKAIKYAKARKDWNTHRVRHQVGMLRSIASNPKPQYKAVKKTKRLYAHGASWLGVSRGIRDFLTQSFWKFDLSSAQLRIASAIWKFPIHCDPEDGSVWTKLLRDCGSRPNNKSLKNDLKSFIYPALFGDSEFSLRTRARDMGHPDLMKNSQIQEILTARKEVTERLRNGEEMKDAWGNVHRVNLSLKESAASQTRSIMAAICQSYEIKLLLPVFDYAKEHNLQIVALLHDGIFATGDWAPHVAKVQELINEEAQRILGVDMPLDAKAPTPSEEKMTLAA